MYCEFCKKLSLQMALRLMHCEATPLYEVLEFCFVASAVKLPVCVEPLREWQALC